MELTFSLTLVIVEDRIRITLLNGSLRSGRLFLLAKYLLKNIKILQNSQKFPNLEATEWCILFHMRYENIRSHHKVCMILVWQNFGHLPNSPNLNPPNILAIQFSLMTANKIFRHSFLSTYLYIAMYQV